MTLIERIHTDLRKGISVNLCHLCSIGSLYLGVIG